jgi:hypothetical protein
MDIDSAKAAAIEDRAAHRRKVAEEHNVPLGECTDQELDEMMMTHGGIGKCIFWLNALDKYAWNAFKAHSHHACRTCMTEMGPLMHYAGICVWIHNMNSANALE